jgi:hypothetical protein
VPEDGEAFIALLGGPEGLEDKLRPILAGLPALRRYPASIQTTRALAFAPGALVLCFVAECTPEVVKRTSMLLEPIQNKVPFMLISTAADPAALRSMANDLKALMGCVVGAGASSLFPRMAAGVFKRQSGPCLPNGS